MGDIIDFLQGIVEAVTMLIKYAIQTLTDIFYFVKNLAQIPGQLSNSFVLFPGVLIPFVTYAITLIILLRVINRE